MFIIFRYYKPIKVEKAVAVEALDANGDLRPAICIQCFQRVGVRT